MPPIKSAQAESSLPQLVITEVSSTVISDEEWVEIYNYGSVPVAISDLVFYENDTNHGVTSVSGETHILPSTLSIIANKADVFKSKNPTYLGVLIDSSWSSLREDGEPIGLKIKGVFVDNVTYGLSVKGQNSERHSLGLTDWIAAVPTVGDLSDAQKLFLEQRVETQNAATATTTDAAIANNSLNNSTTETYTPAESTTTTSSTEGTDDQTITTQLSPDVITITIETATTVNVIEAQNNQTSTESSTTSASSTASNAAATTTDTTTTTAYTTSTTANQTYSSSSTQNTTAQNLATSNSTNNTTQIITNAPPIARITVQSGNLSAQEKTSVNFDGRTSYDPNNDQLRFDWDFGDGTISTSSNPGIHAFSKVGSYTIQLTATDTTGLKGVAYMQVNVLPKSSSATTTGVTSASSSPTATTTITSTKAAATSGAATNTPKIETSGPTVTSTEKITITVTPEQAKALFDTYSLTSTERASNAVASSTGIDSSKNGTAMALNHRGVILNEIFPAPEKGDDEWIELYNTENVAVNLSGMLLADSSKLKKPFALPPASVIPPHGFAIVTKEQSKISLNNGEDAVYLASPTGALIDSIKYLGGKKATSYSRAQDGDKSTWVWTADVTRGKENPPLSTITGTVTNVGTKKENGKSVPYVEIQTADNELHTVMTDSTDKNADVTNGFFDTGSTATISAFEAQDGTEHLSSVKKIVPSTNESNSKTATQSPTTIQLIIGAVVFLLINTLTVVYFVRGFGPQKSASEFVEDPLS